MKDLILHVRRRITDDSNIAWTGFDTPAQFRDEIDHYLNLLQKGDNNALERFHGHFAPTSTFQDHSISNGWDDEYLRLADQFDMLYGKAKSYQNAKD